MTSISVGLVERGDGGDGVSPGRRTGITPAMHAGGVFLAGGIPGFMTMSPEHVDLHRMVDRLDPDQVRALRAVAQQLLRPGARNPDSREAQTRSPSRC
jgi:hypothetical protein